MDYPQFALTGWLLAFLLFLIWFWNSLYVIKEWERGVVLRLGRMLPEAKPAGLRLVLWPIEKLNRSAVAREVGHTQPLQKQSKNPDGQAANVGSIHIVADSETEPKAFLFEPHNRTRNEGQRFY